MVSARSNLVGRLGVFSGTSAGDFPIRFGATVAIELPGVADFLDFVEIELGDEQFVGFEFQPQAAEEYART